MTETTVDVNSNGTKGGGGGKGGGRIAETSDVKIAIEPGTGTSSGPKVSTPAGDAPIIPLLLVGFGAYLLWFGVKYWRGQGPAVWPSYPIKSVLQGHGLPAPQPAPASSDVVTAYETTLGAQIAQQESSSGQPTGGGTTTGSAIANDAAQYAGKVPYVWGGASTRGWDCSGMCNWVIGHDLRLDIPGLPRGQSFTGSSHGPDVAQWLAWTGVAHVTGPPQPGDLVCWGPNAHMGVALSSTEMVSALNPAQGTAKTLIGVTHVGPPMYLRLRAAIGGAVSGGSAQNTAKLLLSRYGWGLNMFQPLVNLWNRESSWSPTARNPSSGALGIPQALGHGGPDTGGTLGNEYGTQFGLTVADARAANSGSAVPQIRWGLGYIAARPNPIGPTYGSPAAAWAHEQQFGWY